MTRQRSSIRLTERDRKVLRVLTEQGAAYSTTIGEILALYGGHASIGDRATRAVVSRWKLLGLVNAERVFSAEPSVVYPTVAGGAFVGLSANGTLPSITSLRHTLLIAAVRPFYERRGLRFTPERLISEAGHKPDGIVTETASGRRACIEVELTQKSQERLIRILQDTTARFDRVVYWATPEIGVRVRGVADDALAPGDAGKVRIQPLPDIRS